MHNKELVQKTAKYVKGVLGGEGSGHDWWHIYRVWQMSVTIAKNEKCSQTVVELGALLHDIADWKFNDGDEQAGPTVAQKWLESQNVDSKTIAAVCEVIFNVSFKGAGHVEPQKTIEAQIVQDADRLDGLGAIGVARTFAYGGYEKRLMYDPLQKPKLNMTKEQYKNNKGTSINHFHEKLLLLKDKMNTKTAKKIAQHRHDFLKEFLQEFLLEWEGKK